MCSKKFKFPSSAMTNAATITHNLLTLNQRNSLTMLLFVLVTKKVKKVRNYPNEVQTLAKKETK